MDGSQVLTCGIVETCSSAAKIAEAVPPPRTACTMAGTPIPLWRLSPAANPNDHRWQGRAIHPDTVVRAPSTAMARVIAGHLDRRPGTVRRGNESLCFRSGFEDEKLYRATRISAADAAVLRSERPEVHRCGVVTAAWKGGAQIGAASADRSATVIGR